ncbi:MAG: hypothetical protein WAK38_28075 [Trebonia sp.]
MRSSSRAGAGRVNPPPVPGRALGQQPEHWSGTFSVIREFHRTTVAGGAENRPPPFTLMPWLPASELRSSLDCPVSSNLVQSH